MKVKFNLEILKQCREQMDLSIEQVEKKVKDIKDIENGNKKITWNNSEKLSEIYCVPDWLFTLKKIRKDYNYELKKSFIYLSYYGDRLFRGYDIKRLVLEAEKYRKFFIEGQRDIGFNVSPFSIFKKEKIIDDSFNFFRRRIEGKKILVFVLGSNKINFKSLCIHYPVAPIIILNNCMSDKQKIIKLYENYLNILDKKTSIENIKLKINNFNCVSDKNKDEIDKIIYKFGEPLLRTIFGLYHSNELTLHKCCKFLKVCNTNLFFEIGKRL